MDCFSLKEMCSLTIFQEATGNTLFAPCYGELEDQKQTLSLVIKEAFEGSEYEDVSDEVVREILGDVSCARVFAEEYFAFLVYMQGKRTDKDAKEFYNCRTPSLLESALNFDGVRAERIVSRIDSHVQEMKIYNKCSKLRSHFLQMNTWLLENYDSVWRSYEGGEWSDGEIMENPYEELKQNRHKLLALFE